MRNIEQKTQTKAQLITINMETRVMWSHGDTQSPAQKKNKWIPCPAASK